MKRGSSKGTLLPRHRTNAPGRLDRQGRSLDDREKEVFAYIVNFAVAHMGHMPTLREICKALEIPAIASANYAIKSLVAKDKLRYLNGFLVIPGSKFTWSEEMSAEEKYYEAVAKFDQAT